ncbi:ubiquinol-cytochrome C chaperone-domain-containing protein [Cantharellus anzutake]|uniref:ubiquinol-cytochrome C chaperone-domain-containing protein n=1 Tax=Cantharellus anzutake TaxID=1750568 RepID=UPI001906BF2D|nr:ubiquinol-cytochrome C chaperone-domain-containing protein [Cantharellus anzutake]KAF8336256.1 ubiquinol-cytochrome C chaperone-domain-containing protein [Cantharellus anzutake]
MESKFLHEECKLPPTYQTWFQITNLHVWLLTARYRALPPSHGRLYVQELVNHFFLDVEHRMRYTLSHKAPERVIKGYMTEMRDQWSGAGLSFDLGLVGSDAELSGAVWRNVFAARGLDGKGEVIARPGKQGAARGLVDLPFHLYVFTAYIRGELVRLQNISDDDVMAGRVGYFGSIESYIRAIERDFEMESEERALLGLDADVLGYSSPEDGGNPLAQKALGAQKGSSSLRRPDDP